MSTYPVTYPTTNTADMKKEGYGVLHSFPFINDGPYRQLKDDQQQKKRVKLNHDSLSENATSATNQIQVPPGVIHIRPTWKPVTLDEKPPFSYATMIAHAILSSQDRKLTLNEIYQWISEQYPCYSIKDHRWQNSIRHNLSLQKAFVKLDRDSDTPTGGKGCYWTILPGYEQQFIDNLMKHDKSITTHTTTSNQKLIQNTNTKKKPSHLFTIFRMTTKDNNDEQQQPEKKQTTKKLKRKMTRDHYLDDSDCDSAVDVDIHGYPSKPTATPRLLQQQQQEFMWQPQEDVLSNQDLMMFNPYIDQSLYLLADNNSNSNYPQYLIDPQPTSTSTSSSSYYYDPTTIPFYNNTNNNNTPSSTPTPTFINTADDTFNPLFSTSQPLYPSSNVTPTTPIPSFDSLPQQDIFYPY